jgi:hypothetical protein
VLIPPFRQGQPTWIPILSDMQLVSGSLGEFLQELFQHPPKGNKAKGLAQGQKHTQMMAKFLQG